MPGKRCNLFEDIGFLKPVVYPRKEVGVIYMTENKKGGIIFGNENEIFYLYDMKDNGYVKSYSFHQCIGKWSRHLNRIEKRKFAIIMDKVLNAMR